MRVADARYGRSRLDRRFGYRVDDRPFDVVAAQLIRSARPRPGHDARDDVRVQVGGSRRWIAIRTDDGQKIGMFSLGPGEVFMTVQPEYASDLAVGQCLEQGQLPAQRRRGQPQCAECMSDVVLAISKRAFTVLPRLAPVHRAEPDQKRLRTERCRQLVEVRLGEFGSSFEGVQLGCVVVDTGPVAQPLLRPDHQIAFGRMQIPARRIAPQRPACRSRLLPGRNRQ